jgi:hypothetical protein
LHRVCGAKVAFAAPTCGEVAPFMVQSEAVCGIDFCGAQDGPSDARPVSGN